MCGFCHRIFEIFECSSIIQWGQNLVLEKKGAYLVEDNGPMFDWYNQFDLASQDDSPKRF